MFVTVMSGGQTIAGGVWSRTSTVWEQLLVVQPSVIVQLRVVVYVAPHRKFVTVPTTVTVTPQPLDTPGVSKVHPMLQGTIRFAGHTTTSGLPATWTVWLHIAALPHASIARQVRVAVKVCPQPALVTVLTMVIAAFASQASVALGGSKDQAAPHSTDLLAAHVITGGVVSVALTF